MTRGPWAPASSTQHVSPGRVHSRTCDRLVLSAAEARPPAGTGHLCSPEAGSGLLLYAAVIGLHGGRGRGSLFS